MSVLSMTLNEKSSKMAFLTSHIQRYAGIKFATFITKGRVEFFGSPDTIQKLRDIFLRKEMVDFSTERTRSFGHPAQKIKKALEVFIENSIIMENNT